MTAAGLGAYAAESVAGDGFIVGVTQAKDLKDPKHPCVGAIEQKHSHFFTADGKFGSRDANGQDVDDGTWRQTDSKTIIIGPANGDTRVGTTFHFTITDNSILKLYLSRRGFSGQVDQSKIGLPGEEDSCHARRGISHRSSEKKR